MYKRVVTHIFKRMSNILIVVQDSVERLRVELMRDREKRLKKRKASEERNRNGERQEGGMLRLNLGANGRSRREE